MFLAGEERERNIHVWLPLVRRPLLGTWPATQACALTGDRTGDTLVRRPAVNPPSPTSWGQHNCFLWRCSELPFRMGGVLRCRADRGPRGLGRKDEDDSQRHRVQESLCYRALWLLELDIIQFPENVLLPQVCTGLPA